MIFSNTENVEINAKSDSISDMRRVFFLYLILEWSFGVIYTLISGKYIPNSIRIRKMFGLSI